MKISLKKIVKKNFIYKILRYREKQSGYYWYRYLFYDNKYKYYKSIFNKKNNLNLIDVGGFKGHWSLFFLNNFLIKKINIFEPGVINIGSIRRRLSKKENVKIHNLGLSDKIEERMFYEYSLRDHNSVYKTKNSDAKLMDQYTVKLTTLDNVLSHKEIYDVLKIDVEGHECNVLKGAQKILPNVKFIEIECHKNNIFEDKELSSLEKIISLIPDSFSLSFKETINKGKKSEFTDFIFKNLNL